MTLSPHDGETTTLPLVDPIGLRPSSRCLRSGRTMDTSRDVFTVTESLTIGVLRVLSEGASVRSGFERFRQHCRPLTAAKRTPTDTIVQLSACKSSAVMGSAGSLGSARARHTIKEPKMKILMVLTSHDQFGNTGRKLQPAIREEL